MAVLKEFRCAAHSAFEATEPVCPACKHGHFVKQEIRTAPAYRRKNMKVIDGIFKETAAQYGLTDMRNDVKSGESVLQRMLNSKTDDISKPRWGAVPHAPAGFSRDPKAKLPTVTAETMGFEATPAAKMDIPPPKTQIVGRYSE